MGKSNQWVELRADLATLNTALEAQAAEIERLRAELKDPRQANARRNGKAVGAAVAEERKRQHNEWIPQLIAARKSAKAAEALLREWLDGSHSGFLARVRAHLEAPDA